MNLKQLEAFVQVAEGGSFSRAAKELYLTQPTISAHIASLEKELNVRLFIRNTKEVSLSEDGKELYKYAKPMMDLEHKIEERFGSGEEPGKHCITIAASTVPYYEGRRVRDKKRSGKTVCPRRDQRGETGCDRQH